MKWFTCLLAAIVSSVAWGQVSIYPPFPAPTNDDPCDSEEWSPWSSFFGPGVACPPPDWNVAYDYRLFDASWDKSNQPTTPDIYECQTIYSNCHWFVTNLRSTLCLIDTCEGMYNTYSIYKAGAVVACAKYGDDECSRFKEVTGTVPWIWVRRDVDEYGCVENVVESTENDPDAVLVHVITYSLSIDNGLFNTNYSVSYINEPNEGTTNPEGTYYLWRGVHGTTGGVYRSYMWAPYVTRTCDEADPEFPYHDFLINCPPTIEVYKKYDPLYNPNGPQQCDLPSVDGCTIEEDECCEPN